MLRPDDSVPVPEKHNQPEILIYPLTKAHLTQILVPVMLALASTNVLPLPPPVILPYLATVTGLAILLAVVPVAGTNFYTYARNRFRYVTRPRAYRTKRPTRHEPAARNFLRVAGIDHGITVLQAGLGQARCVHIIRIRPPNYDLLRSDEQGAALAAFQEVLSSTETTLQVLTTSHPHDPAAYFQGYQHALGRLSRSFQRLTLRYLAWFEHGLVQANVLERDYYVVLSRTAPFEGPNRRLDPASRQRRLQAMRQLRTQAQGIRKHFLGAGAEAEILGSREVLRVLQDQLNPPTYTRSSKLQAALQPRHPKTAAGKVLRVPDIRIEPDQIRLGHDHVRVLVIKQYPDRVPVAWLDEVLALNQRIDASLHYHAKDPRSALRVLRRLKYDTRRTILTKEKKRIDTVDDERFLAEIEQQILDVASRTTRFFEVSIYLAIHASTRQQLDEATQEVEYKLRSQGLSPFVEPYTQQDAFTATLPLDLNPIQRYSQTMHADCAAATYPFLVRVTQHEDGVLLGLHGQTGAPYIINRWQYPNYNSITCGASGSGKSYSVKLEIERTLMRRPDCLVYIVDPLREFTDLCRVMGGQVIHVGHAQTILNPFELARIQSDSHAITGVEEDNAYVKKLVFLDAFFALLLGGLGRTERSILQLAIQALYREKGITEDAATHDREPPVLQDLLDLLEHRSETAEDLDHRRTAKQLHTYLIPLLEGPLKHLNGYTNIRVDSNIVDFDLKSLDRSYFSLYMFVVLDFIEARILNDHTRKKLFVVDEAWYLLDEAVTAKPLSQLARHTRHYATGLILLTQTPSSFLANEYARAIYANCTQVLLLRQERSVDPQVRQSFGLSEAEAELLTRLAAPKQVGHAEGLWLSGDERAFLAMYAAPEEDVLITTAPEDLEALHAPGPEPDDPTNEPATAPSPGKRSEYPLVPRVEAGA